MTGICESLGYSAGNWIQSFVTAAREFLMSEPSLQPTVGGACFEFFGDTGDKTEGLGSTRTPPLSLTPGHKLELHRQIV